MRWFDGNIVDAVKLSKSKNAYFVVYIEGSDDKSKSINKMLNEPNISSRLSQETFVCIKLESNTDSYKQFAEIYKLVPVPSIFFIGDNGVPVEIVTSDKALSGLLISTIDNLIAKKGISGAALSNPSSTSSVQANSAATSSFIAAEQASTAKVPEKKSQIVTPPPVKVDVKPPAAEDIEYETVCEGDVCVRRPKAKSSPESDSGIATLSTSPSTSNEAMDIETEPKDDASPTMTVEEKVLHAKELLEKKRKEKLEKEKEEEIKKELERRSQGQGVAELKRWQQEQEFKNLREERLKEKKENDMQRAKILQQIAQDRADRQKQFAPIPATTSKPEPSTKSTSPKPSETSNITKIQFKMADGSSHTTQIGSDSTLSELRDYARKNIQTSGSFTLSTMYPRQLLGEDKDSETLRTLELCPSSVLLLLKGASSASSTSGPSSTISNSGGFFGMISHVFWSFIVYPAQGFWFWISSFITGNNRPREPRPPTDSSESARSARKFPSEEEKAKRRRVASKGGSGTTSIQKEGNTYRLKDNDSDDENNTWNGNSTQQM